MKRAGLIGGLSWTASAEYYRLINLGVAARRGPAHSADLVLRSLDFAEILARADDQAAVETMLADAGRDVVAAGADCVVLGSFTGHGYARSLPNLPVPFIGLPTVVNNVLRMSGLARLGILATGRSLQNRALLTELCGGSMAAIVPDAATQADVDRVIFKELATMTETDGSIAVLDRAAADLFERGAEAILLATTELSRIANRLAARDRVVDALTLHCDAVVDFLCGS